MLEQLLARLLKRKSEIEECVLTRACSDFTAYREQVARYDELTALIKDIQDIIEGKEDG